MTLKNSITKYFKVILTSLLPVIFAFIIGAILIRISGMNPLEAYGALFRGALVGKGSIYNTLFSATPLIFTGLATAIAFRANIFNMGVEGQLYMGAFAAAYIGFTFTGLSPVIHVLLSLVAAMIVGGLFAFIPGILKGLLDVNEMVVTIMLNYVAVLFTTYLASYPFKAQGVGFAATSMISESAYLPRLMKSSQLNASFFIALIAVCFVYFLFRRTKLGFEINAIGKNVDFSEATGMYVGRKAVIIMVISGMIGGLAGAGEILGVHHRFISGFSPGYGWDGMTIALLGKNNPIGVLAAAIFFGILKNGGSTMELMVGVPRSLINIIQGLIIFFLAVDFLNTKFSLIEKLKSRLADKAKEV